MNESCEKREFLNNKFIFYQHLKVIVMVAWGGFGKILDGFTKAVGVAGPIVSSFIPGVAPIVQAASGLIGAIDSAVSKRKTTPVLTGQRSIAFTRQTSDSDDGSMNPVVNGLSPPPRPTDRIMPGQGGHGLRMQDLSSANGIRNPRIQLV